MAKRRMICLDIIDTDVFLDMPQSSRLLYYELCLRADDDGFISNPKKIVKIIGCSDDDLKVLITKQYIIPFMSGIIVIKHWKIHNYIQKDRYKETMYVNEKNMISIDENNSYYLNGYNLDTKCIQNGYTGKDRIEIELGNSKVNNINNNNCRFGKTEKDSFCLKCFRKNICKNKTSEKFYKVYGTNFEEFLKSENEDTDETKIDYEILEHDWLNEKEGDDYE